ncbi:MAG: circularly permuted type 2 ATP-grasp protein [Verrucomicrobium sp.]|nr:circularly permuted type 2 ATP-grasp protein [Verrucomicrobium sp.]
MSPSDLLSNYKPREASRDEWRTGSPETRGIYDHIEGVLSRYSAAEMERLVRRAGEFMEGQGITIAPRDAAEGGHGQVERVFPFDFFPTVLSAAEWTEVEAGLSQRMEAWNALLRDLYGPQEILKAGIIPYDLVYGDPRYCRECVGLKPTRDIFLHVAAVDLLRDEAGRWVASEDQLSNPTGASYALQNRRTLVQLCPALIEGQPVRPVHHYPTRLLETLQAVTPTGRSTARVVLLSPGIESGAYYDHASLARQMGIPLVQGGDLIVLDNHVYLKTIAGLERVEVICRRLSSAFMDPITFEPDSFLGVPGLVSAVRKGTVTIANSLGADIGDNRALQSYLPAAIEFYLGAKPLLPSVKSHSCHDVDVRAQVFENWDNYLVKTAYAPEPGGPGGLWVGREMDAEARAALQARIEEQPAAYVAQPAVSFSTSPTWNPATLSLEPRHVGLRAFVLQQDRPVVTSCVLTRHASREGSLLLSPGSGGGSKDTWILRGPRREEGTAETEEASSHDNGRLPLGSRTAESLYWIGRYAERAEGTVRLLRVVQQLRLEGAAFQDSRAWQPLWDALASATGHSSRFFKKPALQEPVKLAQYILLDGDNPSSALSCLRRVRRNAQQVREALPPEVWAVLNGLYLKLAAAAEKGKAPELVERLQSMSLQDEVLTGLDELSGSVEKHMLHNDAWHFWQIGRFLERALFTALTMRQVFLKRSNERAAAGRAALAEDDNLDALLRMLAGQYAYRSSYHTRPVGRQVARLLVQDAEFPRSLVFALEAIQEALRATFGARKVDPGTPLHYCSHLLSELNFADIAGFFPATAEERGRGRGKGLPEWMDGVVERLLELGTQVSDHYLNHQAATPVRLQK